MQKFLQWTLETIRSDESLMSWMEEKRFEWVPLVSSALKSILMGHTFIILTDKKREWFGKYLSQSINSFEKNRPLLPMVTLEELCVNLDEANSKENIAMIEDALSISFPNGYIFFYIGESDCARAKIVKHAQRSFLWVMDEQLQNSFYLNSNDDLLNIKLIQLARLFDKSIDAVLFNEITMEDLG
jgi:hypothetical protein